MAKQTLGRVAMDFKGNFNKTTTYEKLDVVVYGGCSYVALKTSLGNMPTNNTYFALLVEKPIKGLDYFTDEEKDEFVANITEDANSVFNQNVGDKTTTFNENAENKMSELDTNFTNKKNELNENATNQINSIDSHVEGKITEINTHTTDKTNDFDTHVTEQTTTFDNHVADQTTAFDTNANNKMNEFNENASSYDKRIIDNSNRIIGIQDNAFEEGQVEGTVIQIEDSVAGEFKELEVRMKHQELMLK